MVSMFFEFLNVYTLLACVIALLWYYGQSNYNYWRKLNVPFLKPVPFFGNIAAIVLQQKPTHEIVDKLYKALHDLPYGGYYEMSYPALLVKDPELASNIMVADFKHFHDHAPIFPFETNRDHDPLVHQNLLATEGERWRILRQKMSSFFSSKQSKYVYEQISQCLALTTEYIDSRIDETGCVDVNATQIIKRFSIHVIGSSAFGIEFNSMESKDKFARLFKESTKPLFDSFIYISSLFSNRLMSLLNLRIMNKGISDYFLNLALDAVQYRRQNGVVRNDLLQLLMSLQNSHQDLKFSVGDDRNILENEKFDEIDIAGHTFLFFLAGYENASTTLSFCLYELALNEKIQHRLRSEVQQVRDKYKIINYDCLKEMTFMDAVIEETLRKYPAVFMTNRKCSEDYEIPKTKVQIPAGTRIIIPIWSIHHDSRYYPNPEIFDPDRFLCDTNQIARSVYLPFGGGPRLCIGKKFAETEMKAALTELIMKYDIKACAKTEIPLTFTERRLILTPKHGIWISLSKRLHVQ